MAYSSANLRMLAQDMSGTFKLWLYRSTDAIATVNTAGYISDATAQGMKVRDVVLVQDTNAPTTNWCTVIAITSGAADLSDGTAIAETNSD